MHNAFFQLATLRVESTKAVATSRFHCKARLHMWTTDIMQPLHTKCGMLQKFAIFLAAKKSKAVLFASTGFDKVVKCQGWPGRSVLLCSSLLPEKIGAAFVFPKQFYLYFICLPLTALTLVVVFLYCHNLNLKHVYHLNLSTSQDSPVPRVANMTKCSQTSMLLDRFFFFFFSGGSVRNG